MPLHETSSGETPRLLAEATLAASASSIDFQSLSQAHTHLRIIVLLRTDNANNDIYLRFNNDSGANYDWENFLVAGATSATWSSVQGLADTRITTGYCAPSTAPSDEFGAYEILVPFYTGSTLKKSVAGGHVRVAASSGNIYRIDGGGTWRSTAAINRVTLLANSNFAAGSRVQIYGER